MSNTQTTTDNFDFCVIGAGPAGIILALEYSKKFPNHTILILEFGAQNIGPKNSLDDSIEIENEINHHPPYECTNKGFGGTSATWGGRCVMFDEIDFIEREILNGNCTWDVSMLKEINPYLKISADYFECGDAVFNLNEIAAFKNTRIAENFKEGIVTDSAIERWSMPTRFGKRYRESISSNPQITLWEGYEAMHFEMAENKTTVYALHAKETSTGNIKRIMATEFVISAGAQESTRLLLKNPQVFSSLDAIPDALGKYYQGHISGKIASVKFYGDPKKTDYGFLRNNDGSYIRRRFQFSTEFLKENNLLNTAIWLDNPLYHNPSHGSGAMSFMYLAMITPIIGNKLAPPAIKASITKGKVSGIGKHLWNILKDFPFSCITPAKIFYKRYFLKRKLPGVFLYSPENTYALHFHAEQIPDAANTMRYESGTEKLKIVYNLNDEDINSVIKLHSVLDECLRKNNCGELEYWFKPSELPAAIKEMSKDGIHQSGTCRIANSPKDGVVDSTLKVFGTDNLYLCSTAVFPTSGQANPTFLLGAFAARLIHQLHK